MKFRHAFLYLGLVILSLLRVSAEEPVAWIDLGGSEWESWTGVEALPGGRGRVAGEAVFNPPSGSLGYYKHGFRVENDNTLDWRDFYGVEIRLELPDDQRRELTVQMECGAQATSREGIAAKVGVAGKGEHVLVLPWSSFAFQQGRLSLLKFVGQLRLQAAPGSPPFLLGGVKVVRGDGVALSSERRGLAGTSGGTVHYDVQVSNCSEREQEVNLSLIKKGWEGMKSSIEPSQFFLKPGETKSSVLTVILPEKMPPGGHEIQVMQALGEGGKKAELEFITASALPHPNILHTATRWQEVRDKVKNYGWAREEQAKVVEQAEKWQVPEVAQAPGNDPDDTMGPFLFKTQNESDLMACGISWQLTGNKKHAEKVAQFLRRLSNPLNGYPKTLRGCSQGLVQEGHFFQHIAMAYDMVLDAGVISEADRKQIEATFRLFIGTIGYETGRGSINNWNISEITGALYCSLAMQDLVTAERFFSGSGGIKDQLAKGTMDDGWWYECSISYNVWCASEFSQVALAYEPWGINFRDMWVPANYSDSISIKPELSGGKVINLDPAQRGRPFGMSMEVWGPNRRPYRKITDLWNSLLPFLDYRGVMFGVNDSTENLVAGGQGFEIAYYLYRDPAYAAIIKRGTGKRDLLYGVPELPELTPEQFKASAYADNVGLTLLRSQTEGRPISEQIQAVLHYGTHGWAHGHFDRTNLLHLSRYGRSFYNPEMIWYSYEPFMYKFYVQTSVSKNMVVVDRKLQDADPGERLLFHSGKMMQAAVVQTNSRWSNPPYGGMVYDYVPVKTFEEKTWREGRFVPIPEKPPAYGTLTDFSEPILQRRLMVVTDDYVVLADFLKAKKNHVFESLFQMKGFQGLEASGKKFLRHDAQWDSNPVSSAQFVTDCNWYAAQAPSLAKFEMKFGEGADNAGTRALYSEDGILKLDVRTLWPSKQEIMVGTAPEEHGVQKRLFYTVRGDGKVLAEGKFGAWILGKDKIDVPVDGLKELELETRIEAGNKPTIFWGNAVVVTAEGKEIPLSALPLKVENVLQPKEPDQDYFGGPIKIAGEPVVSAVPGQPQDDKKTGLVRADLSGINAVRFKAVIGGDYPLGEEDQRRKTYAVKSEGTEARFLTVIEPYEAESMVKSAVAVDKDRLRVELKDGRVQEITLKNFEGPGKDIQVEVKESKEGRVIRTEKAEENP